MLVLVPQGRGNWAAVTMRIDGRHVTPLSVRVRTGARVCARMHVCAGVP